MANIDLIIEEYTDKIIECFELSNTKLVMIDSVILDYYFNLLSNIKEKSINIISFKRCYSHVSQYCYIFDTKNNSKYMMYPILKNNKIFLKIIDYPLFIL